MTIATWADQITAILREITYGGQPIHVPHLLIKADWPEKIPKFPTALVQFDGIRIQYSVGGPLINHWLGQIAFHVAKDTNKQNLPDVLLLMETAYIKIAQNIQANASLSHFVIVSADGGVGVQGPLALQYGAADEFHLGFVINFEVKDNVSGEYQPAA